MCFKRILVVFLMVVVCGLAIAATCGNCDKEVSRDVEFCHWCGKAIDDSDIASGTKASFGSRTFRACSKIWKAIDDADISFDDAQLWLKSLGTDWRCPTKEDLKVLCDSGAKLPFKEYPEVIVYFGEQIKDFPEPSAKGISFTAGEECKFSANWVQMPRGRALAVFSR